MMSTLPSHSHSNTFVSPEHTTPHTYPQDHQYRHTPKFDMPYFDGENPLGWIRQSDRYFELSYTPENLKVKIATAYMSGRADTWLRETGILLQATLPS